MLLDNVIQKTNSLPFHICEFIGGPNLALNRPAFSKEQMTHFSNCKLEWVTDGLFPLQKNFDTNFWHGAGSWVYLQIELGSFYPVKTVIFQTR